MVGHWFADRSFNGWHTGGDNPKPVTADNWRDDLRRSHKWAQHAAPRGEPVSPLAGISPKKINGAPRPAETEPENVAALLEAVRAFHPDFTGKWADVPATIRRRAIAALENPASPPP